MEACQFEQGKEQQVSGAQIPIGAAQADAEIAESSSKSEAERKEELEKMRRRLKEIDEEADNIRANFDKGIEEAALENEDLAAAAALAEKEEVDTRSIFVGNVDYTSTPEEVQEHFQSCGTVNRVTIMTDEFGYPKGFAFVEFVEAGAVPNALLLNDTELHGRPLKVSPKRTNIPGMKQYRGRRFPRGAFMPGPPFYPSYGYGRFPRYRPPMRYSPY